MCDVQNPVDPSALALRTEDRIIVGYMPGYLLDDAHTLHQTCVICEVKVERMNPPRLRSSSGSSVGSNPVGLLVSSPTPHPGISHLPREPRWSQLRQSFKSDSLREIACRNDPSKEPRMKAKSCLAEITQNRLVPAS